MIYFYISSFHDFLDLFSFYGLVFLLYISYVLGLCPPLFNEFRLLIKKKLFCILLSWLDCGCFCCFMGFGHWELPMYMAFVLRDALRFFYKVFHYL
jgi:hypothetical protein